MVFLKPVPDAAPNALGAALWDSATQPGEMLVIEKLAPLPSRGNYQLWLYDAKSPDVAMNAGLFNTDSHGAARVPFAHLPRRMADPGKMAISMEVKGEGPDASAILLTN